MNSLPFKSSHRSEDYMVVQVGVVPMDESKVTMKGRLGPGMMITVDLIKGQVCAFLCSSVSGLLL